MHTVHTQIAKSSAHQDENPRQSGPPAEAQRWWWSGGGIGWEVCDCSAEGGTRLGCLRGTLGAICFIARLPPWSPYCALPPGPRSPSMLHPYLSRRAPLPYLGSGPWRSTTHT